jgi:oligosaccharyltransferase complex subunit delta (ribophorin II)
MPHIFNPSILLFTLLLVAFEALLIWYWVELRLGQVLLYGATLAPVTAMVGRNALRNVAKMRLGRK